METTVGNNHPTNDRILGDRMLLEPMVTNPTTPTQRGQIVNHKVVTCFECGAQGHYWKDCPKIRNQNRGNKARVPDASGKAFALGG
ncbi:putative reverse transcriptase domain-containing protein, partial [Tanacetum coccineum]